MQYNRMKLNEITTLSYFREFCVFCSVKSRGVQRVNPFRQGQNEFSSHSVAPFPIEPVMDGITQHSS